MTDNGFVWEDPPPKKTGVRGEGRWMAIAKQLAERPGEWANVATVSKNYGGVLVYRLKKLGCEATARSNGDGTSALYARWPEKTT